MLPDQRVYKHRVDQGADISAHFLFQTQDPIFADSDSSFSHSPYDEHGEREHEGIWVLQNLPLVRKDVPDTVIDNQLLL